MLAFLRNVGRRLTEWCLPFVLGFAVTAGVVRPAANLACFAHKPVEARRA